MATNPILEKIRAARETMRRATHSARGKDALLYLLFVAVAFVFWLLLSLDAEVAKDYDIPFEITEVPDSVHLIGSVPSTVTAGVRGKGAQLVRFEWGTMPKMKVRFRDFAVPKAGRFQISKIRLEGCVRDYFGAAVTVTGMKPDSISLAYTSRPGVKVALHIPADLVPDIQYTLSGPVKANVDSVTLYSINPIPASLTSVVTEPIVKQGLKDTLVTEVAVQPLEGVKIVPSRVTVTIPVEPLISKKRQVAVQVAGQPAGESMITFPPRVTISYLVPMSDYNHDQTIRAYVNYSDISRGNSKVKVNISSLSPGVQGLTYTPDSVEYIIERR